jgi:hypothetical protein
MVSIGNISEKRGLGQRKYVVLQNCPTALGN